MLAKLCEEILGEGGWRFGSPRERSGKDHLKGYDPSKSPVVKQLEHNRIAGLDYYDEYWAGYWDSLSEKYVAKQ